MFDKRAEPTMMVEKLDSERKPTDSFIFLLICHRSGGLLLKIQRIAISRCRGLHADSASTDFLAFRSFLSGYHTGHHELIVVGQHTKPEADFLSSELAFAHGTALNERRGTEIF